METALNTPVLTTEGGDPPGAAPGSKIYTAIEIAKLCGYTSDRWTRDRRAELEKLLLNCRNGSALVSALKTPDGKRYTEFALEQLRAFQRATSTGVPVLKDGVPVLVKGRARLEVVERQMTAPQYGEVLRQKFGKPSDSEGLRAEDDPEDPGGTEVEIEAELVDDDPDLLSVQIDWVPPVAGTQTVELMDNNGAIASATAATLKGFRAKMIQEMAKLGEQDGALMAQAYSLGAQRSLNQGLTDMASITEAEEPTVARKTTKRR